MGTIWDPPPTDLFHYIYVEDFMILGKSEKKPAFKLIFFSLQICWFCWYYIPHWAWKKDTTDTDIEIDNKIMTIN